MRNNLIKFLKESEVVNRDLALVQLARLIRDYGLTNEEMEEAAAVAALPDYKPGAQFFPVGFVGSEGSEGPEGPDVLPY
jgi:hypothetical protein